MIKKLKPINQIALCVLLLIAVIKGYNQEFQTSCMFLGGFILLCMMLNFEKDNA